MIWIGLTWGCTQPGAPLGSGDTAGPSAQLRGTLSDGAGAPLEGITLQACAHVCVVAFSDAGGGFVFDGLPLGDWSIRLATVDSDVAPVVLPITLQADREIALSAPALGPPVPLGTDPAWVDVAPDLEVQASRGSLGADSIAAAPMVGWPPLDGVTGEPVAGFHLSPPGAGMDVPFRTPLDADVAWCTDSEGKTWIRCDPGTLPTLGSIVFTQESR